MGWDMYTFLANHVDEIYGNADVVKQWKGMIPRSVTYTQGKKKFKVYDRGCICNTTLHDLYFVFETSKKSIFDWKLYYSVFHLSIEAKYGSHRQMSEEEKTIVYYIKFGYWYGLKLDITVDMVKEYRASYDDTMKLSIIDAKNHFLTHKRPILFSQWMYLASNYVSLKHIPRHEILDHYTTNASRDELYTTFNSFRFLSKHPGCISIILKKEYDMSLLTAPKVARFYIENIDSLDLYKGVVEFDPYRFVKEYLRDARINREGLMSIDNAYTYFVKGFVEHKDIRTHVKRVYVLKRFAKNRLRDALQQVPIALLRYIIEFKLYL